MITPFTADITNDVANFGTNTARCRTLKFKIKA